MSLRGKEQFEGDIGRFGRVPDKISGVVDIFHFTTKTVKGLFWVVVNSTLSHENIHCPRSQLTLELSFFP